MEQAGKELVDICAELEGGEWVEERGWPPSGAVPYQTNAWPGRDRCVARLITYLRLHYCKQCVSLCVRPLTLSFCLSFSLVRSSVDAIPSRLPDPPSSVIIRHRYTRPFQRVTISSRREALFKTTFGDFTGNLYDSGSS